MKKKTKLFLKKYKYWGILIIILVIIASIYSITGSLSASVLSLGTEWGCGFSSSCWYQAKLYTNEPYCPYEESCSSDSDCGSGWCYQKICNCPIY